MKIVMGLGNPGKHYALSRHNVGFRCIDRLAARHEVRVNKVKCQSDTGGWTDSGQDILLAKPRTFVNLSGRAAACLTEKSRSSSEDLFVIHDDLDLPAGRMRIRLGGKSGGHRGVKSIIECLGSESFYRIRIGISRPLAEDGSRLQDDEIVDYVLGNPGGDEERLINACLDRACDAIECMLSEGAAYAMNSFNSLR